MLLQGTLYGKYEVKIETVIAFWTERVAFNRVCRRSNRRMRLILQLE